MRVVVVDDNELWRPSLVAALTARDITVVAEAATAEQLHAQLSSSDRPPGAVDVAILDLRLPPTWSDEGIHLARRLRRHDPSLGVIILSGYEEDVQLYYATQALGDLHGDGGVGYLSKDRATRATLQRAVERVAAGRVVVDPIFIEGLADQYRAGREHDDDFSSREVQVLDLLAQGLTNSEIADTLYLSRPVIERHLTKIFQKILPAEVTDDASRSAGDARRENRRVLTVLEWLRRSGRLA